MKFFKVLNLTIGMVAGIHCINFSMVIISLISDHQIISPLGIVNPTSCLFGFKAFVHIVGTFSRFDKLVNLFKYFCLGYLHSIYLQISDLISPEC